ncbi:MAG: M42 family metallopeptidase [Clostridia bacterium]
MSILEKLLNTPSPTGYTKEVMTIIQEELNNMNVDYKLINKGGLVATIKGENDNEQRTISGHVDTLGAMVREVKSDGTLRMTNLGGYMWNSVEGEYCTVITDEGEKITGTIMTKSPSTHVFGSESKETDRVEKNMIVRLDAVVENAEDVRKLGIENGNFIAFDPRHIVTDTGFIKSRHLDDKASVAVMLGVIKQFVDDKTTLPYTLNMFITNYEEVGHGASYGTPEKTVEFLAVDMGCVGGGLQGSEQKVTIAAKDSSGPYDFDFKLKLIDLAKKNEIDYCVDIFPNYGSDASAALRAGSNIKHALIGPGVHASHAWERTHKDGLINTYKLLYSYLLSE